MTSFNNFINTFVSIDMNDYYTYIILLVLFFIMLVYFIIQGNIKEGLSIQESTSGINDFLNNILFIIIVICILVIIVVFILSIANFSIVLYFIIQDFFNTFFNDNLISRDTNHYKLINLLKCTEDNYSDDNLFIFINEYLIIGMSRILYIIVGVVFIYLLVIIILFVYYNIILEEDYKFSFGIDYTFIKISILIFLFIITQISLFTIIFNTYIINIYDNIYNDNQSIDEFIFSNIPDTKDFYEILKKDINDTTTINNYINNFSNTDNLSKNLLLYDLYVYFRSYISSSDPNNYLIEEYLKNKNKDVSFYDLMNVKVILPIQKYHEKLDFLNSNILQSVATTITIFDPVSKYTNDAAPYDPDIADAITEHNSAKVAAESLSDAKNKADKYASFNRDANAALAAARADPAATMRSYGYDPTFLLLNIASLADALSITANTDYDIKKARADTLSDIDAKAISNLVSKKIIEIEKKISDNINLLNDNLNKINKYIINKNNTTVLPIYYILIYCLLMLFLVFIIIIGLMYIISNGNSDFFNKIFYINYLKIFFNYLLKKINII